MSELNFGLTCVADAEVEYGPYRLRVAKWTGKKPADITGDDVSEYENACEEEGRQP